MNDNDEIVDSDEIVVVGGCEFSVRPDSTDQMIIDEVFGGDYESIGRDTTDVILDIGANIGAFSILAAKNTANCKIIAVEPEETNFAKLIENVALNGLEDRIECVNLAVSSVAGKDAWAEVGMFGGTSVYLDRDDTHTSLVRTTTLDEIIGNKKVSYLKMDTEGHEYLIFEGLSDKNLSRIKKIVMEYHGVLPAWGDMVRRLTKYHDLRLYGGSSYHYWGGGMLFGELR
jgi:FkbM family methyltransferase